MARPLLPLIALCSLLLAAPVGASLPSHDSQGQPLPSLAPMVERTLPAVVNIYTLSRVEQQNALLSDPFFSRFFGLRPQERYSKSLGSGVIVDAQKGYILTNHHVVDKAVQIAVNLNDGRSLEAQLVGADAETDVAVIQVAPEGLSALPLAQGELRVGDFVVAIGNPFGLGSSVTSGIVSALGRSGLGIEGYEDFIQTDASINPGNSGGALVNLRGELVGINTAILSESGGNVGIGFAIPIAMAREVMAQLVEHGEVRRGRLGIEVQDLTPDLAAAFGLEGAHGTAITQVVAGSAAAQAGLRSGDVIVQLNGRAVHDSEDIRNSVGLVRVGQPVALGVLRDGERKAFTLVVEEAEPEQLLGGKLHRTLEGAQLSNAQDRRGRPAGVLVSAVERGSPAWNAGLRSGDLITHVNRHELSRLAELVAAAKVGSQMRLDIQRRGQGLYLQLQ